MSIMILPTDTVYGIFTKKENLHSQEGIYALKNRLKRKKLAHYSMNWPFPIDPLGITVIYEDIAYRYGGNHYILEYHIKKYGELVGTSANLSGKYPITSTFHLPIEFRHEYIAEGRPSLGLASTIIEILSLSRFEYEQLKDDKSLIDLDTWNNNKVGQYITFFNNDEHYRNIYNQLKSKKIYIKVIRNGYVDMVDKTNTYETQLAYNFWFDVHNNMYKKRDDSLSIYLQSLL